MTEDIRTLLAVFKESGARTFGLDKVQLRASTTWPSHLAVPDRPPGLPKAAAWRFQSGRLKGRKVWRHRCGDFELEQDLAPDSNNRIGCLIVLNVNRMLRDHLLREGAYTLPPDKDRQDDNLIEPDRAPGIDLHGRALHVLFGALAAARETAQRELARLFAPGWIPELAKVSVELMQVELCWDSPCVLWRLAPSRFASGWHTEFVGAGKRLRLVDGDGNVDQIQRSATLASDPDAMVATTVLIAQGAKGDYAKLYAKAPGYLRFEVKVSQKRAARLLGHPLRLDSYSATCEDLETLGARHYRMLLKAQSHLQVRRREMSLREVVEAFVTAPSGKTKAMEVFDAFSAGEPFRNRGGRYRGVLHHLRGKGLAHQLPSGKLWAASPSLAQHLRRLAAYLKLDE